MKKSKPKSDAGRTEKWWKYWEEYWRRKDTDNPMPDDPECEARIPAGTE
jgi:hypothetical protein